MNLEEIKARINPQYADTIGTDSYEMKWLCDEIESLRQQLAAAIAECKLKDESLEAAHNGLRWWMDTFPLHVTEADNEEMLKLVKALALQPDDSAHGRIEELKVALEIAKKGLRHYENRNAAHGTKNPAAIALDDIAATLKGLK